MPPPPDPYRTLGLPAGAPLEDVRRAYRRLAKANHPDTAGAEAMPRFLAIQAAYETLAGVRARGTDSVPGARASRGSARDPGPGAGDPWQSRAGRRPPPRGAAGDRSGGPRTAPPGPEPAGSGDGPHRASGGARRARSGTRRTPPGGQRPHDRATPGSTSYDFADHEPFDPEWSGASWYGQSSGTYWTINPKEYADPRKHGPEYQARARRGSPSGPGPGPAPEAAPPAGAEPAPAPGSAPRTEPRRRPEGPAATRAPGGDPEPSAPQDGPARPAPGGRAAAAPAGQPPGGGPAARPGPEDRPFSPGDAGPDRGRGAPADPAADPAARLGVGALLRSRLGLALLGWPPIGIGLAILLGEVTGCGRFSASCVDGFAVGTWVGQVAVILALLAVPALAAIAAMATFATLAAAVPVAVLLSAMGGSRDPGTAGVVLGVALALAWLAGVAFAVARRSRTVLP